MRRWIIGAIAAALVAAPASADPRPPETFLERVDELVAWIGDRSDYPGELERYPAVTFLPRATLNYLYFEGAAGVAYDGQDRVKALYVVGMMFLSDDFTLGEDDYVLLHELVHHLQFEHDREFRCKGEQEREAYKLQTEFVEETARRGAEPALPAHAQLRQGFLRASPCFRVSFATRPALPKSMLPGIARYPLRVAPLFGRPT